MSKKGHQKLSAKKVTENYERKRSTKIMNEKGHRKLSPSILSAKIITQYIMTPKTDRLQKFFVFKKAQFDDPRIIYIL